jgi:hypothetical protein
MIMKKMNTLKLGFLALTVIGTVSCDNREVMPVAEEMPEEMPDADRRAELYVTNNSNGDITKYNLTGNTAITLETSSDAAEGIYYDAAADRVYQGSRSALRIDAYSEASTFMEDAMVGEAFSSSADLESPREMAVNGDIFVISDNGSNRFFVYEKSGTGFSLVNTFDIPFPVWGITFKGKDLYAVVDTTGDLAVFYDFLANATDGTLIPSKRIRIEGIVRTHGLT